jgi:Flp pilus assembly protein TadG
MGNDLLLWIKGERGATFVVVALLIIVLVGVAALAIDIGHLFIVRNELQNAADAGALAGARFLYLYEDVGEYVNEGANEIAYDAAIANRSENLPVEVHWSGGNTGDVQRGHWSFSTRTFKSSDNIEYTRIWYVTPDELDANLDFVNAIRVRTRRQDTPAASFFARIFGYEYFFVSAEAVAYVGFAGTLAPGEVDQPIAICKESLLMNGQYTDSIGRMVTNNEQVATPPWTITLPVVECPENNVVGAVTINIVWITGEAEDPSYSEAPRVMEDPRTGTTWASNDPVGQLRWDSFVQSFNLRNLDGSFVPYQEKAIYFLPDCNHHQPKGRTGGENFGIMAKIPVLVR